MLPSYILKMDKKDITATHCRDIRVWAHYWILDSEQRHRHQTVKIMNDDSVSHYQQLLVVLHDEIINKSRNITEKLIVDRYADIGGYRVRDQRPSHFKQIGLILNSQVVQDMFQKDLMGMINHNYHLVYSMLGELNAENWMNPSMKKHTVSRSQGFDFELREGGRHMILKLASVGSNQVSAKLQYYEQCSFGLSLRVKKTRVPKGCVVFPVQLSAMYNTTGQKTYLCINKSRFPQFGGLQEPQSVEDIIRFPRDEIYTHAHFLASKAITTGRTLPETLEIVKESYHRMENLVGKVSSENNINQEITRNLTKETHHFSNVNTPHEKTHHCRTQHDNVATRGFMEEVLAVPTLEMKSIDHSNSSTMPPSASFSNKSNHVQDNMNNPSDGNFDVEHNMDFGQFGDLNMNSCGLNLSPLPHHYQPDKSSLNDPFLSIHMSFDSPTSGGENKEWREVCYP